MTDPKHDGHLGSVYAATDPGEVAAAHDKWAHAFDAGMAQAGYRHPSVCLALLARHLPRGAGPLLDAGGGTGMIGDWLGIVGYSHVEGLDISEGMLAVAARKGNYRALHRAALGRRWRWRWRSRMAILPGSCHPACSPPGMSGPRCCRNCCASAGWAA